MTNYIKIVFVE